MRGGQLRKQVPAHAVDQHDRDAIDVTEPAIRQRQLVVDRTRGPKQRGRGGQHVADRTGHDRQSGTRSDVRQPLTGHPQLTVGAVGQRANLLR